MKSILYFRTVVPQSWLNIKIIRGVLKKLSV